MNIEEKRCFIVWTLQCEFKKVFFHIVNLMHHLNMTFYVIDQISLLTY